MDVALSTVPTLIADSEETRDSEDEPEAAAPMVNDRDDDRQKLTQRWALPVPGSIGCHRVHSRGGAGKAGPKWVRQVHCTSALSAAARRVHSRGGAGEAGPKWTRQTMSGPLHSALPVATESLHSPPASLPCPAGRLAVGLALGADTKGS